MLVLFAYVVHFVTRIHFIISLPLTDCCRKLSQTFQSTGSCPILRRAALQREKHLLPRNGEDVLRAPSGLGWDVQMTSCFTDFDEDDDESRTACAFLVAGLPLGGGMRKK